ncbi:hypothetical protein RM697_10480 [Ichthyenterobacterium sp. W332]|uniref:Uncharacterized protein n=1 Tax=Microcosmobacter mediterraneus TaxID=3075607 RepID=A0ABU2YM06_9FLAO|nr:hypothetical protein [Ichthyenterobacterium sp. W332]MDT0559077.1 hypothetical protein [Ichthyenterobacterium sp. W332]
MKKIITLCFFVFAIAFGSQNAFAQDNVFKEKAYQKTEQLKRTVKFSADQREQVVAVLTKYYKYASREASTPEIAEQRLTKISKYVDERLKEILTEEQFQAFKKAKLD